MKIKNSIFELLHGDIVNIEANAIYCPDTVHLAMNSGLASILKTKTGDEIYFDSRSIVPLQEGEVASVKVKGIPASQVIFASIIANNGEINRDIVGKTIQDSLALCGKLGLKSISFPMISSPRSKIPFDTYAKVMLKSIVDYLLSRDDLSLNVSLVIFNDEAYFNAKTHLDILRQEYLI